MDWSTLKLSRENSQPTDGLFSGFTTETDGTVHRYDYIMGNPPFVGKKGAGKEVAKYIKSTAEKGKDLIIQISGSRR